MSTEILQLQKDLVTLGQDPGALDGLWGSRTKGACHDAVAKYALTSPSAPPLTSPPSTAFCEYLTDLAEAIRLTQVRGSGSLPPDYHDLVAQASTDPRKGPRPWSQVTGVTLHQTGCPMGESPSRWYGLKAHYGVTYSGQIYRVHPEEEMVWHAQQLSKTQVGIEISGFFCGVEGDKKTRPGGPREWGIQSVTPAQIAAVKELVRYLARLLLSKGSKLTRLNAHRQSTDDRTPDPGSKVWQEIAMPLMAELSLSDGGPGWVVGKGQPIPQEWDPRSTAKY